jgi:hypothetical protein
MPKRPVISVDVLMGGQVEPGPVQTQANVDRKREDANIPNPERASSPPRADLSSAALGDEPTATLYLRCPQSVALRLKQLIHQRLMQKRKRVTQNEVLLEAVLDLLRREGA